MQWTSWFHCSNDTSVLPGVTSLLKVLIFGVPKCRPDVRAVISCPISDPDGAGHGTCRGGPEGTLPPAWSLWLYRWSGLPLWIPPSPSWKGDLLVILLGLSTAQWVYPFIWRGIAGGTCILHIVQFPVWGLPWADAARGQQGLQVLLGDDAVFPHLGEFVGEVYAALSPHLKDFYVTSAMYAVTWASEGAMALTVMASPRNSFVFMIAQVACCSSSREQNKTTDSIVE